MVDEEVFFSPFFSFLPICCLLFAIYLPSGESDNDRLLFFSEPDMKHSAIRKWFAFAKNNIPIPLSVSFFFFFCFQNNIAFLARYISFVSSAPIVLETISSSPILYGREGVRVLLRVFFYAGGGAGHRQ